MKTHMLVVSAITHSEDGAREVAQKYGIDSTPVFAHDSYMFVARPKREFQSGSLKQFNGQGCYLLKGMLA